MSKTNYINRLDYKLSIKDKLYIVLAIFVAILLYFKFVHVDKTPQGYAPISPELNEFLKTSDYYGKSYTSGKKIVLYQANETKDPYNQEFMNELLLASKNPELLADYEFMTFQILSNKVVLDVKTGEKVMKASAELQKTCRKFCIINPAKQQLYFYFDPQAKEGKALSSILNNFEFWGIKIEPEK